MSAAIDAAPGEAPPGDAPLALRVRDLNAGYGALLVLHDIALDVSSNEVVSVLGANGAGKTTLLRAIAGLIKPRSGLVELFGERIQGGSAYALARAGIGHVPSGRELFPELTVADNLALGGAKTPRGRRKELYERSLDLFPALPRLLDRRAGKLSGGEQQMLAVGRALMTDPKLLLLDEPSTGLAPMIVLSLFEALERLIAEQGMSILLVEQNAALALRLSSRAYILETGRVVLSGDADELAGDPRVVSAYLGGH
jgi:branched-chain amino acid transport system ATP-binding protein